MEPMEGELAKFPAARSARSLTLALPSIQPIYIRSSDQASS